VIVAVRALAEGLAVTLKSTAPFPEPEAPLVTVIHVAWLVAVQLHPAPAVTATVPVPAPAPTEALAGLIAKMHAAACVTVNVWPAIVIVPVRGFGAALGATL
jgi:hypothetical protein